VRLTYLASFACVAGLSAPAWSTAGADAGVPETVRSKMEGYLATHDVAAVQDLRAVQASPEALLMTIADDARVQGLTRARAVSALALLPSTRAQAFFGRLVKDKAKSKDPGERLVVRRAALALGWMAGPGTPESLATLFDNDDEAVRLDAAIALGLTRSEEAAGYLQQRLAAESSPRVRDQIDRQLRILRKALQPPAKPAGPSQREPMRGGW
jgi:HEAT repeat protein